MLRVLREVENDFPLCTDPGMNQENLNKEVQILYSMLCLAGRQMGLVNRNGHVGLLRNPAPQIPGCFTNESDMFDSYKSNME